MTKRTHTRFAIPVTPLVFEAKAPKTKASPRYPSGGGVPCLSQRRFYFPHGSSASDSNAVGLKVWL